MKRLPRIRSSKRHAYITFCTITDRECEIRNVSKFGEEQERLKERLLEMSSLVEQVIHLSVRAVTHQDRHAADQVLESETRINEMEVEIDNRSINLLALHQPMATNLRFLVAVLKINTNLERMGDLSVNIAQT